MNSNFSIRHSRWIGLDWELSAAEHGHIEMKLDVSDLEKLSARKLPKLLPFAPNLNRFCSKLALGHNTTFVPYKILHNFC
jgi:hypothetical protein